MAKKKTSRDELAREVGDEDEQRVVSAIDKIGVDKEIEIVNHEGRKLKIKAKKIDPVAAVEDGDNYC
jgi:hypothetical protein